jgi:hypothetical protein
MLTDNLKFFVHSWLAALRSGNYSQAKHRLQEGYGYCCLGVACVILDQIEHCGLKMTDYDYEKGMDLEVPKLKGENLASQPTVQALFEQMGIGTNGEPLLQDNNDEQYNRDLLAVSLEDLDSKTRIFHELAGLNDTFNLNFSQIADFIEVTYGSEWGL